MRIVHHALIIVYCVFTAQSSFANNLDAFDKADSVNTVEFRAGSVGAIKVPVDVLSGSKISSADGIVVLLQNGSYFSIATIRDDQVGFEGVDMRTWPLYLLGLKNEGIEPKAFIEHAKEAGEIIRGNKAAPVKITKLTTDSGTGYLVLGDKRSHIFLTDDSQPNIIAQITTTKMTESEIQQALLDGVIK